MSMSIAQTSEHHRRHRAQPSRRASPLSTVVAILLVWIWRTLTSLVSRLIVNNLRLSCRRMGFKPLHSIPTLITGLIKQISINLAATKTTLGSCSRLPPSKRSLHLRSPAWSQRRARSTTRPTRCLTWSSRISSSKTILPGRPKSLEKLFSRL